MHPILMFASEMVGRIEYKEQVYGDSWKDVDLEFLKQRLQEKTDDMIANPSRKNAVDIANIAFFLHQRLFKVGEDNRPETL